MSMFYKEKNKSDFYHGNSLRHRDELKRQLLELAGRIESDMDAMEARLEHSSVSSPDISHCAEKIFREILLLAGDLNSLAGDTYAGIYNLYERLEKSVWDYLNSEITACSGDFARVISAGGGALSEKLAGGKAAVLSQLKSILPGAVPPAFVITSDAYHTFIEENRLHYRIHALLTDLDVVADGEAFRNRTREIREHIMAARVPDAVAEEIEKCAGDTPGGAPAGWAVRSSCVGEDGRRSFAGLFDSVLGVPQEGLSGAYRRVLAGRFTDRAVYYRIACGLREMDTPMAVLFMPMAKARSAGVLYTRDPRGGSPDNMLINSVWGLAADLLSGRAEADVFTAVRDASGRLISSSAAIKPETLVSAVPGGLRRADLDDDRKTALSLSAGEAALLVQAGLKIEEYFGAPQDIEWIIDESGEPVVVQSRRLLTRKPGERAGGTPPGPEELLYEGGVAVFPGWAEGRVFIAGDSADAGRVPSGAVLVARESGSEIFQALPHLAGLVIEEPEPPALLAARVSAFGLPCIAAAAGAAGALVEQGRIALDADACRVYSTRGSEREFPEKPAQGVISCPLHELVFSACEPPAREINQCGSLRDIVRMVRDTASAFDAVSGKMQD